MRKWLFENDGIWLIYGFICWGLGILVGWAMWG